MPENATLLRLSVDPNGIISDQVTGSDAAEFSRLLATAPRQCARWQSVSQSSPFLAHLDLTPANRDELSNILHGLDVIGSRQLTLYSAPEPFSGLANQLSVSAFWNGDGATIIISRPALPPSPLRNGSGLTISRDLFVEVLDFLPATVSIKDRVRRYRFVNRLWEQYHGLMRREILGRNYEEMIPPNIRPDSWVAHTKDVSDRDQQVLQTGEPSLNVEESFTDTTGFVRTLLSNKAPLLASDGEAWAVLSVTVDISERKRVLKALEASKEAAEAGVRSKARFIAAMSHDFRTPLHAIIGFTDLLERDIRESMAQEHLQIISTASKQLLDLANAILDVSKLDADELSFTLEEFSPTKELANLIDLLSPMAAEKSLCLTLCVDENLPPRLIGERRRLRQVMQNLIDNAIKFTLKGSVDVFLRGLEWGGADDSSSVLVRYGVRDTGVGIQEA